MLIMRLFRLLLIFALAVWPHITWAGKLNVVFVNPGHPHKDATGSFWSKVNTLMQAAANDLDIRLVSLFAQRNHLIMKSLTNKIRQLKPDYVILVNEKGVASQMLPILARDKLPVFMLLNSFSPETIGGFDQQQRLLIKGSVKPDNFKAGKLLAERLIGLHVSKKGTQPSTLYALLGDYTTPAALEREAGLKSALKQHTQIRLLDSPVANWSRVQAFDKTKGVSQRHTIDIIWAGNDPMAFGAKAALLDNNQFASTIGGINWDAQDEQFPLDVSLGGHVTLGAKAIIMLHDFHHGLIPPENMHKVIDIFHPGTREEIVVFNQLFRAHTSEQIDFKKFSKVAAQPVPFSIQSFLNIAQQLAQ